MTFSRNLALQGANGLTRLALMFLRFRHEHETWWEILDAVLVGAVFVLLYFDESASHIAGIISHVIVALLLVIKLMSIIAVRLRVRWFNNNAVQ